VACRKWRVQERAEVLSREEIEGFRTLLATRIAECQRIAAVAHQRWPALLAGAANGGMLLQKFASGKPTAKGSGLAVSKSSSK
jgi:hypothetical protein